MSGSGPQQPTPPSKNTKASFDPGWNDPPPLSYSPQGYTTKPRTQLNKRVAFPLSTPSSAPSAHGAISRPGLPPMPAFIPQSALPVIIPQWARTQECEPLDFDSEIALKEVTETLNSLLDESSELGSKAADIRKRIAMMESMWSSGQLNTIVQERMRELAFALQAGRTSEADELHKALMVEQGALVSQWMPGVRRLVHHRAARLDLLAIDDDEN